MDHFVPVVAVAKLRDVTSKVRSNAEGGPQTRRVKNARNHARAVETLQLQVPTLQAAVSKMLSDHPDDDRSFSVLPGAGRDTMTSKPRRRRSSSAHFEKEATTWSLLIRRIPLEIFAT